MKFVDNPFQFDLTVRSMVLPAIRKARTILKNTQSDRSALVYQVAHDLQSPIAALNMVIANCGGLNEETRLLLNSITSRIHGMTKTLLNDFTCEGGLKTSKANRQIIDCAQFLNRLVTEKKCEFSCNPASLVSDISFNAHEILMDADSIALSRSLSNLINNAVDAVSKKSRGTVWIKLFAAQHQVKFSVQDNGSGMSPPLVRNLNQQINFTAGKAHGHGLGMMQVWEMLEVNKGKMSIRSQPGQGTKITLTFKRYLPK